MINGAEPEMLRYARDLIGGRRAIRAFRPIAVERHVVADVIDLARYAPSGSNTQPWKVYAVSGARLQALAERLCVAFDAPDAAEKYKEEYDYYPRQWRSPFIERRRKNGWDLYGLLGIRKGDKAAMHAQHRRNLEFFGAPVALFFTVDREMGQGSLLDYGMFAQNVMLAARAHGLATCPQAAVNPYHMILREEMQWDASEMLVCCMSLGYPDHDALISKLQTEREPVTSFLNFIE